MSRHQIPALNPKHEVWVGWDHPLMTFFGQVYDHSLCEEQNPIHWVGAARPRELYEIDDLARAMRRYAVLSREIRMTLYGDKDEGR